MTIRPLSRGAGLCLISLLTALSPLLAQDQKPGPWPQLTNTTVSIPWNDLGKFLDQSRNMQPQKPPVDYLFSPAVSNVTIDGDRATIDTQCEVTALNQQWAMVPIGPAKGGITKVTIDGQPASLVMQEDMLYVLISGGGKKKLAVSAASPITLQGGEHCFMEQLVPSPIVLLNVTVPGTNLDVKAPGAATVKTGEAQGRTTISGDYRGGEMAAVTWAPRAAQPQPSRIYADTNTLVSIEEGLVRFNATVTAQIIPTAAKQLMVDLDPQVTLLNVTGKGVATWTREPATGVVTVTFDAPVTGEQALRLVYERDLPQTGGEIPLPVPAIEQSKRDRGNIAIAASSGEFGVTPGRTDLARIGLKDLPADLRSAGGDSLQLAYSYSKAPAKLSVLLARQQVQPAKIYAQTQTLVTVENSTIHCHAIINYSILHTGVTAFRIGLPEGVEILGVTGESVRGKNVVSGSGGRVLAVDLSDLAQGNYTLTVDYEKSLKETDVKPALPLARPLDAAEDSGIVGMEVRGGLEVTAVPSGAQPIDVKELPETIWSGAQSPLLLAFKYSQTPAQIALNITKHAQVNVLVAMCDVCEASTTVTSDGKCVTKLMYVTRNNSKQFMTLDLPDGAQVWSTFVDDVPVAPVRNAKGELLIPLKKSDNVDPNDEDSYRAKRERRRAEGNGQAQAMAEKQMEATDESVADLKPYDVEVVFVTPTIQIAQKGEIDLGLPKSDVPVGQLAWAVFVPKELLVLDTGGNFKQVPAFSLPFRHFGEVEYERQASIQKLANAAADMAQAAAQAQAAQQLAEKSKAVGVLPVRIEIPITGQIQRFEKFLVVDETPQVSLIYRTKAE